MSRTAPATRDMVRYSRHRFVARFPRSYRYTPSHFWLAEDEADIWCVGLTHFAARMLGEIVEFDIERAAGNTLAVGEVIGWVEGMKAVTDLFCVADGELVGVNADALGDPERVCKDPYGTGWLYAVRGTPDERTTDVEAYLRQLGETLDNMQEQPWRQGEMT
ncbi:MAG: glycine cleavage system protein H [Acidobacteriota bacterium]